MKYKKSMFIVLLAIFLFSLTGVFASEMDTPVASDDTGQVALSVNDEGIDDNLQTSEENTKLAVDENDETQSSESDSEILTENKFTYSDLRDKIGSGGNINLTKGTYTYNDGDGDTIEISNSGVINGNGAVIDMNGSNMRAFYVEGFDVTIKNLTIKNAKYNDYGGAVYFPHGGTVTDCTFINNSATGNPAGGGAVYFDKDYSEVLNCNFINNTATFWGGAVNFNQAEGTVANCNFTGNTASRGGGAVYFEMKYGEVLNCNFTGNTASRDGGAVFFLNGGTVSNCNFTGNKATGDNGRGGAVNFLNGEGNVTNCNFTNNTASSNGGAVHFTEGATGRIINCNFTNNQATYYGGAIDMGSGTVTNCNFTNNTATSYGGAIDMSSGTVTNCNFTNNKATGSNSWGGAIDMGSGTVTNCNFTNNTASGNGGAVYFLNTGNVTNCNFVNNTATQNGGAVYFADDSTGSIINCNFTNNTATGTGNYDGGGAVYFYKGTGSVTNCNFTGNTASREGGAIRFRGSGTVSNCNFTGNTADKGGAVFFVNTGTVSNCNFVDNTANSDCGAISFGGSGTVTNCNFTNNKATGTDSWGGAILMFSGTVTNCNFTGNTAIYGGAIRMASGSVSNCNFTGNNATAGSAIYFSTSATKTVSNSRFLNNRANAEALEITKNDNNITINFTGRNNLLNAIYSSNDAEVTFTNVTYWGAKGIATVSTTMSGSNKAAGQNITVGVVVNGEIVLNQVNVTNEDGTIVLNINAGENYYITARHDTDSYYTEAEKAISNNTKFNVNVTSQTTNNKTVNITAKSNIPQDVVQGKLLFIVPTGANITANYAGNGTWWAVYEFADYGDYQVNATYIGLDNVTVNNATISISKTPTNITVEITSLDLITSDETVIVANLTPADAGNITFTSSDENVVYVDSEGNVIAQGKGQAIITLSFAENNDYAAAENRTITVTVSPADASVTVDKNTLDLKIGEKYAINAAKHPDTILLDITYTSSNSLVARVDENGIVTAVGEGTAVITVEVGDDDFYAKNSTNVTVTVRKVPTQIGAKAITATYNVNKNLVITLKDSNGKALSGLKITVDLNGAKTYTTDKNGQIKVKTKGLAPKKYTAKITFKGNAIYAKSTKNVKVTVKKAKTKITAKKKVTFKAGKKSKKLKITLKDNKGKPIKNVKVRLMLKKIGKNAKKNTKTKTKANKKIAKTNKKGKATFKIKKNKKAKYLAYVKFYANKYYKKTVKKIKITIK